LPCGAYGGKKEIMDHLSPVGSVYQAGTLSGNPLVMSAGIQTLTLLKDPTYYQQITDYMSQLVLGLQDILPDDCSLSHIGSMFTLFFRSQAPTCLSEVQECDFDRFKTLHHHLLSSQIYFAPSQYETQFISCVHQDPELNATLDAFKQLF